MKLNTILGLSFLLASVACGGSTSSTSAGSTAQITLSLKTASSASLTVDPSQRLAVLKQASEAAPDFSIFCFNKDDGTLTSGASDSNGDVTLTLGTDEDHVCAVLNDDFETMGVFVTEDADASAGKVTTGLKPTGDADLGDCILDTDTGVVACDGTVPSGDIQAASTTAGVPNDLTTTSEDPCMQVTSDSTLAVADLDSDGSGLPDLLDNDANGNGLCDNVDNLEKKTFCPDCDRSVLVIDNANHYCNPGNDSYRVTQKFYSDKEISSISVDGPAWTDSVKIADSPDLPDDLSLANYPSTARPLWSDYNDKKLVECDLSSDNFAYCMPVIASSGSLGDVMEAGDAFKYSITYADSTTATSVSSVNMVLSTPPESVKLEGTAPACPAGTNGSFVTIDSASPTDFTLEFTIPAGMPLGLDYSLYCSPLTLSSGTICTIATTGAAKVLKDISSFAGDQRTSATQSQSSGVLTISTSILETSTVNAWACGIVAADDADDSVDTHGYLLKKSDSVCLSEGF